MPVSVIAEQDATDRKGFKQVESNTILGATVEEAFEIVFEAVEQESPETANILRRFFSWLFGEEKKTPSDRSESRTRRRGEPIGELPDHAEGKQHLYGWFNRSKGEYVTAETTVEEDMTLTAVGINEEEIKLEQPDLTVEIPAGAVPENTEITAVPVPAEEVAGIVEEALGTETNVIRAVDITLTDTYINEEVKPDNDKTVEVTMSVAGMDTSNLRVVHILDDNSIENIPFTLEGGNVVFQASSFSVYAVVESGEHNESRMMMEFYNKETKITTIYVKNDDTATALQTIVYDPGVGTLQPGEVFCGWFIEPGTTETYTTEDIAGALDIDEIREWATNKAVNSEIVEDTTVRISAVICKQYHISFVDENGAAVATDSILVKSSEYPNHPGVEYTIKTGYEPKDDVHNFEGWNAEEDDDHNANIQDYVSGTLYKVNDKPIITGDVTFMVNAPAGHWLVFDENGKGGTYNAPVFVKENEVTVAPADREVPVIMARNGYDFIGWYYFPEGVTVPDQNDKKERDLSDAVEFDFGHPLEKRTTVYAKWGPVSQANYLVVLWTQNDDRTAYEVAGSNPGRGTVGQGILAYNNAITGNGIKDNQDEDYVRLQLATKQEGSDTYTYTNTDYHYTGFCLKHGDGDIQDVEITPEGDAVLNLYFDRIIYDSMYIG